jgi:NTP pyrophosphatase (non-canonical NTP hydrolase)
MNKELLAIHVARVLQSAVHGVPTPEERAIVISDLVAECAKQDAKWGQQNHDDYRWNAIAGEEVGEVAQAILHTEFGGKAAGTVRTELVQLGAVILQWIACIDRNASQSEREQKAGLSDPELKPPGHSSWEATH